MKTSPRTASRQRAFAPVKILISATAVVFALAAVSFGAVTSAKILHRQVVTSRSASPSIP